MKTSSAKAKGRRCAKEVRELLLQYAPLGDKDIFVTSSGETGADLKLSEEALKRYPLAIECKNVEKLNIWAALEQADGHHTEDQIPVVFFKRNRSNLYAALDAEAFVALLSLAYHGRMAECQKKRETK